MYMPCTVLAVQEQVYYFHITGKLVYLANEPFKLTWCFLIWRLRRGYYSNNVVSAGKV